MKKIRLDKINELREKRLEREREREREIAHERNARVIQAFREALRHHVTQQQAGHAQDAQQGGV